MMSDRLKYFNDPYLDQMRLVGDPPVDELIARLDKEKSEIGAFLSKARKNTLEMEDEHLPSILVETYNNMTVLPSWADTQQMQLGAIFFEKQARMILSMLGFLSLPYCYAAAKGAQVLYLTQRIQKDTYRRLLETAQFVTAVLSKNAFEPEGQGKISIFKVRLIHALVRARTAQNEKWQKQWGLPVNQEDMTGTNLAFSWIVLRGLNKTGVEVSREETTAFFHLWNVIGFLMGVKEELLPQNGKEAFWLDKVIVQRQFEQSEAGVELTRSLLKELQQNARQPAIQRLTKEYMTFLLGEKVSQILGLSYQPGLGMHTFFKYLHPLNQWLGNYRENILTELNKEVEKNQIQVSID